MGALGREARRFLGIIERIPAMRADAFERFFRSLTQTRLRRWAIFVNMDDDAKRYPTRRCPARDIREWES